MKSVARAVILLLLLVPSACSSGIAGPTATPTIFLITSTLPVLPSAAPTGTPAPPTITPTPAPVNGTTTSQLNVRATPSMTGEIVGSVGIFSKVQVFGKDSSGDWYQIAYSAGPGGVAWITAAYVQVDGSPKLPVVESGATAAPTRPTTGSPGSSTPAATSAATTPTGAPPTAVGGAPLDYDSADSPAASAVFSPLGARALQYTDDVSAPEGDAEDWMEFTPYAGPGQPVSVEVKVDCVGNTGLKLQLQQAGVVWQTWEAISCGQRSRMVLSLFDGPPYLLRLMPSESIAGQRYVSFTVVVDSVMP